MIASKYPAKKEICAPILAKEHLSFMDVMALEEIINSCFTKDHLEKNQKYRSYNTSTIIELLDYQKKNQLNNTQLSRQFKISRNSVSKWKSLFSTKQ